ncbi:MAG: AhpC/TSA family protein [Candidatus Dormibacteraeota bacterium]|nr:AhpC/TSA family protein [Candidatus Dormibacteraeota bacterium]
MDVRALSEAAVLDADGGRFRLGDLWQDRPAVVVWLRHFGCVYCREQAGEFTAAAAELDSAGVRLAFVGNGTPRAARWFRDRFTRGATVVTDPKLVSYRIIGARRGVFNTLGPHTWRHGLRALRRGARQGAVRGDPFQQGGVIVVAPDGRVAFEHISRAAGDHPDSVEVVEAAVHAAGGVEGVTPAATAH